MRETSVIRIIKHIDFTLKTQILRITLPIFWIKYFDNYPNGAIHKETKCHIVL